VSLFEHSTRLFAPKRDMQLGGGDRCLAHLIQAAGEEELGAAARVVPIGRVVLVQCEGEPLTVDAHQLPGSLCTPIMQLHISNSYRNIVHAVKKPYNQPNSQQHKANVPAFHPRAFNHLIVSNKGGYPGGGGEMWRWSKEGVWLIPSQFKIALLLLLSSWTSEKSIFSTNCK